MSELPGFVKVGKWKPEDLDGKAVVWQVIHRGDKLPAFDGALNGKLSAQAYEDGMIVKILIQQVTGDFAGEAVDYLTQGQVDSLVRQGTGFYLA